MTTAESRLDPRGIQRDTRIPQRRLLVANRTAQDVRPNGVADDPSAAARIVRFVHPPRVTLCLPEDKLGSLLECRGIRRIGEGPSDKSTNRADFVKNGVASAPLNLQAKTLRLGAEFRGGGITKERC